MWLNSWAFATSPHGLGLSESRSWELTPRELKALADVHYSQVVTRWATSRADFFNAHFRGKDTAAWLAEDFLGEGNREKRTREQQREVLMVQKANAALVTKIKRGTPPTEEVPDWARGEYRGGSVNG